jgi:hypothetical protein
LAVQARLLRIAGSLPNVVVQREKSLLGGKNNRGGRELLRDRTHVKNRLPEKENIKFQTAPAISPAIDEIAFLDANRAAVENLSCRRRRKSHPPAALYLAPRRWAAYLLENKHKDGGNRIPCAFPQIPADSKTTLANPSGGFWIDHPE